MKQRLFSAIAIRAFLPTPGLPVMLSLHGLSLLQMTIVVLLQFQARIARVKFSPLGTTMVKYSAVDIYGNSSFCQFEVIVKNETPPVFTGCPATLFAKANESGQAIVDWIKPTAASPCSEVSLTVSHNPGSMFEIGTTDVEYQAIDDVGNVSKCTFRVNVTAEALEIGIPQVITPDGDGINDTWQLSNIEKFKDNKIVIVDRWGSVIYRASGYNNESIVWLGANAGGGIAPTGTYFYTLSVDTGTNRIEKRGFIELIR